MIRPQDLPTYTYADYICWEGNWELIEGIPYAMSPMPARKHQVINGNLLYLFYEALSSCRECKAYMPIDWKISEEIVVQPDISVVCGAWNNENYLDFPPELIVEILSPSTAMKDLNLKYDIYEKQQVKYYLIIDPKKEAITIYEYIKDKFAKIKVMRDDIYTFDIQSCKAKIDFSKIWN